MFKDSSIIGMLANGGVTMIVLALCSVLSLTVFLERWKTFRGARIKAMDELKNKLRELLMAGKASEAISFCESYTVSWLGFKAISPLANVVKTLVFSHTKNKEELANLGMRAVDKEIVALEKNLGIIGTIASISLYIGLFGTVLGIINAFESLSIEAAMGPQAVTKGIAEALVNTAGGLFVAVCSSIAYNYFVRTLKRITVYLDDAAAEFIEVIKK